MLPGEVVAVPIFAEADSTVVRNEAFRVVVVIFHIGERVDSGHYQAALAVLTPLLLIVGSTGSATMVGPLGWPPRRN